MRTEMELRNRIVWLDGAISKHIREGRQFAADRNREEIEILQWTLGDIP
jgi:hypothetical protein